LRLGDATRVDAVSACCAGEPGWITKVGVAGRGEAAAIAHRLGLDKR
jgi:hypothetical protein